MNNKPIAIRISEDLDNRLTKLAKMTNRSKGFYAREAIATHIEDLEDTYLALQLSESIGKTYTLEEVEKMCDLDP